MISNNRTVLHRVVSKYRKSKVVEWVLNITGKDPKDKKWIFILGCYNSGTTLLNQILAEHSAISGLPDEGVMLTTQLVKPEDFGWRRMWWKCKSEMENSIINKNKSARVIKRHWSHFYAEKNFLLEKSISNVCRISFLEKEFKPAFFIHIVRNGYAAAEGIRRKAEIIPGNKYESLGKYPIEDCIHQWVETLKEVDNHKTELTNFLEISYEELTENTESVLKQITSFLRIQSFENDTINKTFSVHEKSSEIKNMNSQSIKKLSSGEIAIINKIAGDKLIEKGYSLL